jgi:predicted nucleic acid-binding protein
VGGLLFDASSLLASVKAGRIEPLLGQSIQWLTVYEVCNAVWKESQALKKLTREEAISLLGIEVDIVENMRVLEIRGFERDVLETAFSTGMSAYDASYIVLAEKQEMTLVTEDEKLRRAAVKHVQTTSISQLSN